MRRARSSPGCVLEGFNLLQARPKTAGVLVVLWCLCIGGFAVSDNFALSFVLLFVGGFLNLAFGAMTQTLVQLHAPNHMRGRVIGLFNMCYHGMRAFSGVTVGMAGALIGIHWSLGLSAAALFVIAIVLLLYEMRPATTGAAGGIIIKARCPSPSWRGRWPTSVAHSCAGWFR